MVWSKGGFLLLMLVGIFARPAVAEQFTLECEITSTKKTGPGYTDSSWVKLLSSKSSNLTIDTDEKKFSRDGVSVSNLKEITDNSIVLSQQLLKYIGTYEAIDRYTGAYEDHHYIENGDGERSDITRKGRCRKVGLIPLPNAKF